jgi:hypothetical protein
MAQNWTAGIVDGFKTAHGYGQKMWSGMQSGSQKAGSSIRTNVVGPMDQAADLADDVGSKLGGFGGILGSIGAQFLRFMFNPLTLVVGLMALAIKRMTDLEGRAVNVSRSIGAGQQGMSGFVSTTTQLVDKWKHLGVETQSITSIITSIGESMRNFNSVSNQAVSTITQLSLAGGATKEEFGAAYSSILQMSQGMFSTRQEANKSADSMLRYTRNLAAANGVPINQMMNQLANVSDAVASTMGSNPKALANAVIQASKLGTTLDGVASIMNNMMNLEQSIENEMEASVLLGKNLNMERLRSASIMGDEASVMRELKSLLGSQAEYEKMMPMQRQAYAKALGMSVSEMQRMIGFESQAETQTRQRQEATDKLVNVATTFMEKIKGVINQIGIAFAGVLQGPMNQFRTWLTSGLPGQTGLDKVKEAAQKLAGFMQQGVTYLANWGTHAAKSGSWAQAFSSVSSVLKRIIGWLGEGEGRWKNWKIVIAAITAIRLTSMISALTGISSGLMGVNRSAGMAGGGLQSMIGLLGSAYVASKNLKDIQGGRGGVGWAGMGGMAIGGMLGGPLGMAAGGFVGRAVGEHIGDAIIRPGAPPIHVHPSDTLIAVKEAGGGASYISHKGIGTESQPPQPITYNFDLGPVVSKLDALTSAILQGGKVYLDGRAVGRAQAFAATGAA